MILVSEAQVRRGEEVEIDPDEFQDLDNEYELFAGTTSEADDEEADWIYEKVKEAMDNARSQGTHKSPFNVDRFTPVVIIPLDIDIQKPTTFGQTLQTTIFMTRGRLELQMQEARKEQP
ncbi:uncharacterized protein ARMOST_15553 [Armillaria ostoyae]|uniref:PRP1 splicing factor N-terminal domain-containing protein n=1 Tax=Armillaria ostoyae TaxID=47428 RepID=A0A284RTT9_ARMOS|nr:uncharacterized protein ARMOST_15553 [Armillaria ostoyae]